MAYTSILAVHRLDRSVEYVMDKDKTSRTGAGSASSLAEAVDDARDREKTECGVFESAIGCTLDTAYRDMRANKERWGRMDGVQGYHLVQSFAEGELTPELAHRIGLELAERLLHGQYPAVVATHLNTHCLHNHIVWDSVAMDTGRKYRSSARTYYTGVRAESDRLCRQYGLSVIESPESERGKKQYGKWLAEQNGKPTWRTAIRQDVDSAIAASLTWRQFVKALEGQGYELRMQRKYPTLRPPGKERCVRFKTLGKQYTPEAIRMRILYPRRGTKGQAVPRVQYARLRTRGRPVRGFTGLRALYYRYLYELGALPRKPSRSSYAVRQDAYKLDQRIRQMEFLSRNNIDTLTQLETHRQALQTEIGQLLTKRKQLPKTDEVQSQHESVNTALKQLRQEERLCRKIAEHSLEVQQHLTEARRDRAEQQQREQEHERDRRPNIDLTL